MSAEHWCEWRLVAETQDRAFARIAAGLRFPVTHVAQAEPTGCGVACLAMLTGQSYDDVRATVDLHATGYGLSEAQVCHWLAERGFWLRRWWVGAPPEKRAPVALVLTMRPAHWVVVDGDRVLDPARGVARIEDYAIGQWIDLFRPEPAAPAPEGRADD